MRSIQHSFPVLFFDSVMVILKLALQRATLSYSLAFPHKIEREFNFKRLAASWPRIIALLCRKQTVVGIST